MSLKNHFVADSDMHVMEPPDLWERYIDPEFRHVAPKGLSDMKRDMRVMVKSRVLLKTGRVHPRAAIPQGGGWREDHDDAYAASERQGWDSQSQLDAMNAEGLDMAVMFPSRGLFVLGLDSVEMSGPDGLEPKFAAAIARAYNDWMHDFCSLAPARMFGAAMVAPHSVEDAVAEARRCVEEYGFKAVFLSPGAVSRRPWHHRAYDPLWAECERLGVPIAFHGGGQNELRPDFSLEIFDDLSLWHTFSQPLGIMTVTASFCLGGVLERFPNLRVALLEGNCAWAPWLIHRLDEHYEWVGRFEFPELTKRPSDYFKSNCWLSIEVDEEPGRQYIEWFGDDNLVFSTDYPHGDSKYPNSVHAFDELPIPDAAKRKIVSENWGRLYNIPLDRHTPAAD
jgi:predicted TIM-barrel fold metal-dependent hydrolase